MGQADAGKSSPVCNTKANPASAGHRAALRIREGNDAGNSLRICQKRAIKKGIQIVRYHKAVAGVEIHDCVSQVLDRGGDRKSVV